MTISPNIGEMTEPFEVPNFFLYNLPLNLNLVEFTMKFNLLRNSFYLM